VCTTFKVWSNQIQCKQFHFARVPQTITSEIRDDFYVLLTPLSQGKVAVSSNGRVLFDGELRPGMLRLVAPGESTQVTLKSQLRNIALVIPGASARKALRRAGYAWHAKPRFLEPLTRPSRTVARLASALQEAANLKDMQRLLYVEGLTDSLFACLTAGQRSMQGTAVRGPKAPLSDSDFATCTAFADQMIGQKLTVERWAAVLKMNSSEFTQRFRKRTSLSPYAWFLRRRLERAKKLLQEPQHPIIEVALRAGFGSQSHLTEAFRRHVGCSPARWREARYFLHSDNK
jgi:AraC family transcriptional regulator